MMVTGNGAGIPPYNGPDFAEVGWIKEYGSAPIHFVAWANSRSYGTVDISSAVYPAYHDYYVEYIGNYGGTNPHLWYGHIDGVLRLQVLNRNAYVSPLTSSERQTTSDDGYNAFKNIYVKNSKGYWQRPTTLGQREDNDPGYYFNPYTVYPYGTAWQASRQ